MLLLSEEDIERVLPLPECMLEAVDAIEEAERAHAEGRTTVHRRIWLQHDRDQNVIVLPAIVDGIGAAVRTYSHGRFRPGLGALPKPRRLHGIVALYDDELGMIAVIEDGRHLNRVRTGAPTGVAARHLANPDASEMAIIGTGKLSAGQVAAVCAVRPIERIRVYSRTPEHVAEFVRELQEMLGIEVVGCGSGEEAVRDAAVVITITNARRPILERSWLASGATVLSIASNEVAEDTIVDSRMVTTSIDRLLSDEEGREPIMTMVHEGRFGPDDLVELNAVVTGRAIGRQSPDELVTFISTGSAQWDVAVPAMAYRRARAQGLGVEWP
ncbi:MAG: Ornithine cyclodeaminase [Chloroflexi bacterium]|nr:Ornithine cyclodeaminase [Chloroflexota bacterium]